MTERGAVIVIPIAEPYDFARTVALLRHGSMDPTTILEPGAFWRAWRTPNGPATLHLKHVVDGVHARAWGPGAEHAMSQAAAIAGAFDNPAEYRPSLPLLHDLARRFAGVRIPRTGSIMDSLIPSITEQKVTSQEAWRAYRGLVSKFGGPAPGPNERLKLPPDPAAVATAPYYVTHRMGLERRRTDVIRNACARANRMEEAAHMTPSDARARLEALPGIGPWTSAEVTQVSHGDPDAVSVGDFHLPNLVAWALAGEARGTDERMLELLAGEQGHRGRAIRLLQLSGIRAPAFGPRNRIRDIAPM